MIIQRFLKIRSVKPNPALTVKMGYMRRHRPWLVQALFPGFWMVPHPGYMVSEPKLVGQIPPSPGLI